MIAANVVLCSLATIPPVNINILVVCVVQLLIDRTLCALLLPTTRQQLVAAKLGPITLACTSTAPQLNQAGWA